MRPTAKPSLRRLVVVLFGLAFALAFALAFSLAFALAFAPAAQARPSRAGRATSAPKTSSPSPTPTPTPAPTPAPTPTPTAVVNLNTATAEQLDWLPRIGPALASRILRARARRPFRSVAALRRVRGIGRVTLRLLAPHLVLDGPTTMTSSPRAGRRRGRRQAAAAPLGGH
ncbi:MAG: helix-hairpin-helix domain-containing protein [Proteobacteria bacterium]|nr:helix-hairpin-helix domain-containing protein [Pseudomonadota bacterium]